MISECHRQPVAGFRIRHVIRDIDTAPPSGMVPPDRANRSAIVYGWPMGTRYASSDASSA